MTINNSKYYASNSANASDAQNNLTHNTETVTHTSNRKEKITHTRNGNFEQKIFRNRTLSVVVLTMNPGIENRIAPIGGAYQILLTPVTKEFVATLHGLTGLCSK